MKKMLFIAALCILLFLTSCAVKSKPAALKEPEPPYIRPMLLTAAQQEIVSLVADGHVVFYDYALKTDPDSVKIVLDVYKNGELIDTKTSGAHMNSTLKGIIAVAPDNEKKTDFEIRLSDGDGMVTWVLSADIDVSTLNSSGMSGGCSDSSNIVGEKYPLYAAFYSASTSSAVDGDMLAHPERLTAFEYACIVSCEFSPETAGA